MTDDEKELAAEKALAVSAQIESENKIERWSRQRDLQSVWRMSTRILHG